MKKQQLPKQVAIGQLIFAPRLDYPKAYAHTECPGRVRVKVKLNGADRWLTKRELNGTDSDYPAEEILRVKDLREAVRLLPGKYAEIERRLCRQGLLTAEKEEQQDLGELLKANKDDFFAVYETSWGEATRKAYQGQYDIVAETLTGCAAEALHQEEYAAMQEMIRVNALKSAQKGKLNAENSGDTDRLTSSGAKQLHIMKLALRYLKDHLGIPIPADITMYQSKTSNQELMERYVDSARILPDTTLQEMANDHSAEDILWLMLMLMVECGLRRNEELGLLWGELHCLDGSQGLQYFIRISGQYSSRKKLRVNETKTPAAYRVIPLPQCLGRMLFAAKAELETRYGCMDTSLMLGEATEDGYMDDAKTIERRRTTLEQMLRGYYEDTDALQQLADRLPYVYDITMQRDNLQSTMLFHSLRRNCISRLYCAGGIATEELYAQAGHTTSSASSYLRLAQAGKTGTELYRMCLEKQVGWSSMQPQLPLQYAVVKHIGKTEVPTTQLALTLKPGQSAEVTVWDTEPDNALRWSEVGLQVTVDHSELDETPGKAHTALLADAAYIRITGTSYPFGG